MSDGSRRSGRIEPAPAWTVVTDAPLAGLAFAREAGMVLAWDETDLLALIDARGARQTTLRADAKIVTAAISDDGMLIAVVMTGGRLLLLGRDLEPLEERSSPPDPSAVAVDPHGR